MSENITLPKFCTICQKPLKGKQELFCSSACKGKSTNNTFQNYKSQRARGKERKDEIVQAKGGACEACGYSRSMAALCFHHRDPSTKKFQLDLRNLSNRNLEAILAEVDKCSLLCCNCHAEKHHPEEVLGTSASGGT